MSKFKANLERPLREYANRHYVEHLRRVQGYRSSARSVRFANPVLGAVILGSPFLLITGFVYATYRGFVPFLNEMSISVPPGTVMPILYGLTGLAMLLGFIFGLILGLSKSHDYLFKAEGYEMNLRQDYYLRVLANAFEQVGSQTPSDVNSGISHFSDIQPSSAPPVSSIPPLSDPNFSDISRSK